MKILNFGSLNIDLIYQVPHIVRPGETLSAASLVTSAGGKGANQSVALAKAGAPVWHAGTVGTDGAWLRELLGRFGVNTEFIRDYDGPTGQALIQVDREGQNSIVLYGGGNLNNGKEHADSVLAFFDEGDYLVLQNEINITPYVLNKAAERGMKICLNPAPFTDEVKSWPLEKLEYLVVNEIEGQDLAGEQGTPEETLDRLTAAYPQLRILLTAGKEGAFYGCGGERIYSPIVDTPVEDTTAAGDTFLGYFLSSRVQGLSIQEAMDSASRASSLTVSRSGAMESIPLAGEL
ncbi:MAG: ribokinase [Spirochaetales bacterium]|nr:ribokinase [Spirochaetales bacterium]